MNRSQRRRMVKDVKRNLKGGTSQQRTAQAKEYVKLKAMELKISKQYKLETEEKAC